MIHLTVTYQTLLLKNIHRECLQQAHAYARTHAHTDGQAESIMSLHLIFLHGGCKNKSYNINSVRPVINIEQTN